MQNAKLQFKAPAVIQTDHSVPKEYDIATLEFAAEMIAAKLEVDMVKLAGIRAEVAARLSSSAFCDGQWLGSLIGNAAIRMSAAAKNAKERSLVKQFAKSWGDILSEFSEEQIGKIGGILRKHRAKLMYDLIKGRL